MGLDCGSTFVKYILFVFNFLIAIGGLALVVIGAIALSKTSDISGAFTEDDPTTAAIVVILFGGIVFLISFFGCCGAIRESYCMVMTYASILFVIFVAQVVLAILVLVNRVDYIDKVLRQVGKLWANPEQNRDIIKIVERTFDCCGWPESVLGVIGSLQCLGNDISSVSCRTRLHEVFDTSSQLFGWIAIGVAGVQLVALIFSCCLGNNVRNAQRRYA